MPNVVYSRQVEFTAHGPVVEHIIVAPRPTGLYALAPILSNEAVQGKERVTSMQKRVSGAATVAGINGGSGTLLRDGSLDMQPADKRSSVGIDTDGTLHVDRVALAGTWQGSGQRRILGLNEVPRANRTTLYTRAYGTRTPAESGGAYAVLQPFPASKPNTPLTATVTGYLTGGNQPIPADGAVLAARGSQAGFLTAEAPVGSKVTIVLTLTPPWANVPDGVGGGPVIVRDGKPVYRAFENFTTQALAFRSGRSAVGQTADGRIVLLVADGKQPGYSTGLTNFELALTMMRLGCVTASALDSGAGATMAFDGADPECVEKVRAATQGGLDHVFEFAGSIRAFETAYRITRRGGTTVTAGLPPPHATFALPVVNLVAEERTVKGSYIGTCVPSRDLPRYIDLYRAGKLPVNKLMSGRMKLDQINEGFDLLHEGKAVRQVVTF